MFIKLNLTITFLNLLHLCHLKSDCATEKRALKYYKIKSCHKSNSPPIIWKQVSSLAECEILTKEKRGLAFNFSPSDAAKYLKGSSPNCHVLGCPYTGGESDSSLVTDLAYDYYSAYGNMNVLGQYILVTQNASCIKQVGLFAFTNEYENYTQGLLSCQKLNGDLADITSEYRTAMLSQIIKVALLDWYKAVYVGLDDMQNENVFRSSSGKRLSCSKYRAWAPGHPRSKHKSDDCVTLDADKLWRVVNCGKVKLRGLCELYSHPPIVKEVIPKNVTCDEIFDNYGDVKKKCFRQKEWFDIYRKSSRLDRCSLFHFANEEEKMGWNLNDGPISKVGF